MSNDSSNIDNKTQLESGLSALLSAFSAVLIELKLQNAIDEQRLIASLRKTIDGRAKNSCEKTFRAVTESIIRHLADSGEIVQLKPDHWQP